MRAAAFDHTGGAEVVAARELPAPTPGPGQLLVRVAWAALNPIDVYLRAGLIGVPANSPQITGSDFAGVVEAVGEGVAGFAAGHLVWGSNLGLAGRQGSCAELAVVPAEYAYPLPEGVAPELAAASALVGITAHLGLFHRTNLRSGETVFVHGGAGGVGSMVVQMAKLAGARVVATAGSAEKLDLVRSLGADAALDYRDPDLTAQILAATGGKGADVYFETQPPSDLDAVVARTAPEGRVVVMAGRAARPVLPNGPFYVKGLQLIGFAMFAAPPDRQRAAAGQIGAWLAAGRLKPLIGRTFDLAEASAAHALQEANTLGKAGTLRGKILVRVGPDIG